MFVLPVLPVCIDEQNREQKSLHTSNHRHDLYRLRVRVNYVFHLVGQKTCFIRISKSSLFSFFFRLFLLLLLFAVTCVRSPCVVYVPFSGYNAPPKNNKIKKNNNEIYIYVLRTVALFFISFAYFVFLEPAMAGKGFPIGRL